MCGAVCTRRCRTCSGIDAGRLIHRFQVGALAHGRAGAGRARVGRPSARFAVPPTLFLAMVHGPSILTAFSRGEADSRGPAETAVQERSKDETVDEDQLRQWRLEFEAAARRPLEQRFRYAFIHTNKPVHDDDPYR